MNDAEAAFFIVPRSSFIVLTKPFVRLAEQLDVVERRDADAAGEQTIADGDRSVLKSFCLNQDDRRWLADSFFANDGAGGEVELHRLAAYCERGAA